MNTHKIGIKFPLYGEEHLSAEVVVPLFHRWIQHQAMPEHLLIDVADYEHVRHGPGMVLVAHEANIHIDHTGGQTGLLYLRKQPLLATETFSDRLRACLRFALEAAARLEHDVGGKARVRTGSFSLILNDRLHAPNTPQTFEQVKPQLEAVLAELYYAPFRLEHHDAPEKLFEVRITSEESPSLAELRERLGAPAPM